MMNLENRTIMLYADRNAFRGEKAAYTFSSDKDKIQPDKRLDLDAFIPEGCSVRIQDGREFFDTSDGEFCLQTDLKAQSVLSAGEEALQPVLTAGGDILPLILTKDSFSRVIRETLPKFLPKEMSDYEIMIHTVTKANVGKQTAVSIRNPDSTVTPNIYIDEMYEAYKAGQRSIADVCTSVSRARVDLEKNGMDLPEEIRRAAEGVLDWRHIRNKVMVYAVGVSLNRELLETVPHKIIGDVAATYRIHFGRMHDGSAATCLITNTMLEKLGVNAEDLHNNAVSNTEAAMQPKLMTMYSALSALSGESEAFADGVQERETDPKMYILTNAQNFYGAGALFYPDISAEIEKAFPNGCYILPSSVHEVILVSSKGEETPDLRDLMEMVHTINETTVLPEERLSDLVMEYDADTREICIAVENKTQKESMPDLELEKGVAI